MITQIKMFSILFIYVLGALFMIVFPPKNFNPGEKGPRGYSHRHHQNYVSHTKFLTSEEVGKYMVDIARDEPELVTTYALNTRTSQNLTMWVMEIRADRDIRKSGILVIGGVDPMAWASVNAVLELAEEILYEPEYRKPFLTDYDWYLIPLANPEGYDFTLCARDIPVFSGTMWRRNMTSASRPPAWYKNLDGDIEEEGCFGTNVDRNFAYHWQDEEVLDIPQPCTQHYAGEHPFSTIEASNLRYYITEIPFLQMAVHLRAVYEHSKESIVYPWRYARHRPSKWHEAQQISEAAAREARLPDGKLYEVHQSSEEGIHGGSLEDYLKGVVGVETVYTVHPYHEAIPNSTDFKLPDEYVEQAVAITLGLVRARRSISKENTLWFFGTEKQY